MNNANLSGSHVWSGNPRQTKQDGTTIILRQCSLCRRDFAQGVDDSDWRAAYIGVFKVELLADAVNERWLKEECPRRRVPEDDIARATLRD